MKPGRPERASAETPTGAGARLRMILHFNVTQHPSAGWLSRQVTEAFPRDTATHFLLRDREASYGEEFIKRVKAMGITQVITAPRLQLKILPLLKIPTKRK